MFKFDPDIFYTVLAALVFASIIRDFIFNPLIKLCFDGGKHDSHLVMASVRGQSFPPKDNNIHNKGNTSKSTD